MELLQKYSDVINNEKFDTSQYAETLFGSNLNIDKRATVISYISEKSDSLKETKVIEDTPVVNRIERVISSYALSPEDKKTICWNMISNLDCKEIRNVKDDKGINVLAAMYKKPDKYEKVIEMIEDKMGVTLKKEDALNLLSREDVVLEKPSVILAQLTKEEVNEVFEKDGGKTTLLIEAIKQADDDKFKDIIEAGGDISVVVENGLSVDNILEKEMEYATKEVDQIMEEEDKSSSYGKIEALSKIENIIEQEGGSEVNSEKNEKEVADEIWKWYTKKRENIQDIGKRVQKQTLDITTINIKTCKKANFKKIKVSFFIV